MNDQQADDHAQEFYLSDEIERAVLERLSDDDDPQLWSVALGIILHDAAYLCRQAKRSTPIYAEVGACSHWLRPHQFRWTDGGGFAVPVGYSGGIHSIFAYPEFDWSFPLTWDKRQQQWALAPRTTRGRTLNLRITLPTRTRRHPSAAIHVSWSPGSPLKPNTKDWSPYGFRKNHGQWQLTAVLGDDRLFAPTSTKRKKPSRR